ncbi:sulfurtransferase complex subunit TusB [Endozoicomonas sp. OPT23]|uniref:sulfurtransferase complex subunit TusB n=1 Tax=Endozoicomonas sp. OPT23 TaxID=2072845 RepID=UPI00129BA9EC|nr:sulfurtransferase complex subunit TusB [Endozoicomonas sp. OPT23]MRI34453.1 sulfurtransferase complex subunit TusB [Endozoicomonas sp. OPT23]
MATLHTVNKNGQPLELCLRAVNKGDSLLLIEDGVYALFETADILAELIRDVSVYVLEADVMARGVTNRDELDIELVDYAGFVSLTEKNEKVLSWF